MPGNITGHRPDGQQSLVDVAIPVAGIVSLETDLRQGLHHSLIQPSHRPFWGIGSPLVPRTSLTSDVSWYAT